MTDFKRYFKEMPILSSAYYKLQTLRYHVQRACGYVPHQIAETRDYWESRGEVYIEQAKSTYTDPDDPHFLSQSEIIEELRGIPWNSFLEVGCGFGRNLKNAEKFFPNRNIVGVDFSRSNLLNAVTYLYKVFDRIALIQADVFNLPFLKDSFDLIFTRGMLIHIHPKNIPLFMDQILNVGKKYFIFIEYITEHFTFKRRPLPIHVHNLSEICDQHGLIIEKSKPLDAFKHTNNSRPLSLIKAFKK
jgi:SAM-dependent methyltransferase